MLIVLLPPLLVLLVHEFVQLASSRRLLPLLLLLFVLQLPLLVLMLPLLLLLLLLYSCGSCLYTAAKLVLMSVRIYPTLPAQHHSAQTLTCPSQSRPWACEKKTTIKHQKIVFSN
jgi:hypothetical protein